MAEVEGRLACIGLQIGPPLQEDDSFVDTQDEDLRPLQSAEIRLPLRDLVDRALESKAVSYPGPEDATKLHELLEHMVGIADVTIAERKKTGRPPLYGPGHFERVAQVYRKHLENGGRAPTKAVADQMAGGSKSTAAKWVARARGSGLLPPYEEEK